MSNRADWPTQLATVGYLAIPRERGHLPSLRDVLATLEPMRWQCSRLVARSADQARPNSLSSRYGFAALPLHTDGAALTAPPRYVLLAAPPWRAAPTTVLDLQPLIMRLSFDERRSLFRIDAGRLSYLQRFVDVRNGDLLVRFNDDIMRPADKAARAVRRAISNFRQTTVEVSWAETRLLVLDNWRVLHGRGMVKSPDKSYVRRMAIWAKTE